MATQHGRKILKFLSEDYHHKQFYTDISLVCGVKVFKAHKIVLAAFSPFFASIFANEVSSSKGTGFTVCLEFVSSDVLACLLQFMYDGLLQPTTGTALKDLERAANILIIHEAVTLLKQLRDNSTELKKNLSEKQNELSSTSPTAYAPMTIQTATDTNDVSFDETEEPWLHFNKTETLDVLRCKLCDVYVGSADGSTELAWTHLQINHVHLVPSALQLKDPPENITTRKSSYLWQYFEKLVHMQEAVAVCTLCGKTLPRPTGSTSNMQFHMLAHHKEFMEAQRTKMIPTSSTSAVAVSDDVEDIANSSTCRNETYNEPADNKDVDGAFLGGDGSFGVELPTPLQTNNKEVSEEEEEIEGVLSFATVYDRQNKRRKNSSKVWNYFGRTAVPELQKCFLCGDDKVQFTNGCYYNLRQHLMNRHPEIPKTNYTKSTSAGITQKPVKRNIKVKRKISKIWNYFGKTVDPIVQRCSLCGQSVQFTNNSYYNLKQHLMIKHPDIRRSRYCKQSAEDEDETEDEYYEEEIMDEPMEITDTDLHEMDRNEVSEEWMCELLKVLDSSQAKAANADGRSIVQRFFKQDSGKQFVK